LSRFKASIAEKQFQYGNTEYLQCGFADILASRQREIGALIRSFRAEKASLESGMVIDPPTVIDVTFSKSMIGGNPQSKHTLQTKKTATVSSVTVSSHTGTDSLA
jgi:hypothetical protein